MKDPTDEDLKIVNKLVDIACEDIFPKVAIQIRNTIRRTVFDQMTAIVLTARDSASRIEELEGSNNLLRFALDQSQAAQTELRDGLDKSISELNERADSIENMAPKGTPQYNSFISAANACREIAISFQSLEHPDKRDTGARGAIQ